MGRVDEQIYLLHQQRKERSRKEKEDDKKRATENTSFVAFVVDVQKVFTCPNIKASSAYYKTKLKVHNWSTFNLATSDVLCYVWHEGNGDLDSSVFASMIVRLLRNEFITNSNVKEIVLWSDGCTYQNRCENVSNAILHFCIETGVTVVQKFLEVGHTQMEVDSVHSTIERKIKNREHFVPGDFLRAIKESRINPKPYAAESLNFTDFTNYAGGYFTSIRPGNKKGDPFVTDLRALLYSPQGHIMYKLNLDDSWIELPRRPRSNVYKNLEPLYKGPLAITDRKFKDLQEMKSVLERDYHHFYNELRHVSCDSGFEKCPHII